LKRSPLKRPVGSKRPQPRRLQGHCQMLRLGLGVDLSGGTAGRCCPSPKSREWPSDFLWGTSLPQGKESATKSRPSWESIKAGPPYCSSSQTLPTAALTPLPSSRTLKGWEAPARKFGV